MAIAVGDIASLLFSISRGDSAGAVGGNAFGAVALRSRRGLFDLRQSSLVVGFHHLGVYCRLHVSRHLPVRANA